MIYLNLGPNESSVLAHTFVVDSLLQKSNWFLDWFSVNSLSNEPSSYTTDVKKPEPERPDSPLPLQQDPPGLDVVVQNPNLADVLYGRYGFIVPTPLLEQPTPNSPFTWQCIKAILHHGDSPNTLGDHQMPWFSVPRSVHKTLFISSIDTDNHLHMLIFSTLSHVIKVLKLQPKIIKISTWKTVIMYWLLVPKILINSIFCRWSPALFFLKSRV